jgi:N4-gp56 family major capsid protein
MAQQQFTTLTQRIDRFAGQILKRAEMRECLAKTGRQIKMPQNKSDTYVALRYVPYNATTANSNLIFPNGDGDRGNALVAANQIAEGITPTPDSIQAEEVSCVLQQFGCLYGYSDKVANLHFEDIPPQMVKQVSDRVATVDEMICYGVIRGSTNTFFGGTGTTIATVNGPISLPFLRRIVRSLEANGAEPVNQMLGAGPNFNTDSVEAAYIAYCHTNLSPDIRDLPGFIPVKNYANGKPLPYELGSVENVRFITSPYLPELQNAGASVTGTGLTSTSGTSLDVYPLIVMAQDFYSQVTVRGLDSVDPTILEPGRKEKADPLGQRGYVGTKWWKQAMIENQGWGAVGYIGLKNLPN